MKYRLDSSYTFTQRTRPGKTRKLLLLLILLLGLIVGGNLLFGWFAPAASLVARPFLRASAGALNLSPGSSALAKENAALRTRLVYLEEREQELERLRASYGVEPDGRSPIVVRVISKPNQTPYDVVIVDAGSKTAPGIKVGQTAVVGGGIVMGQVIEVQAYTAKVRLFSSSGLELPVVIGDTGIPGVAKGVGAGNFTVSLPRGVELAVGDSIIASAFPNYILGRINYIDSDPNDPFQTIRFRFPVNFFQLEWLELYE